MGALKLMVVALPLMLHIHAAQANELPVTNAAATMAIYLAPHETQNPVMLQDRYYSYWFNRGDVVLTVAQNTFRPMFREVSVCEGTNPADVITWVKPQLFYNPQMHIYYADLKVNFYRADGKPLATLKAKAQRNGFLSSNNYQQTYDVYADAFRQIAMQFSQDAALQDAIRQSMAEHLTRTPCGIVGLVPYS